MYIPVFRLCDSSKDWTPQKRGLVLAQGYKTFFMLNSAEHEILNAYKYENIKKFSIFSGSEKSRMLLFLLINVKMPTVVGILTFMSRKISSSAELSMKIIFITSGPFFFHVFFV